MSPALKQEIDRVVSASGARFVEVAVMAPVLPYGHRVPMLLGGSGAALFAERMTPFGMRCDVLSAAVGTAAAVKMCRSIVVKGLEALMCECVLGASRYDAGAHVFASLNESFPGIDWQKLADYMVGRVVVARRASSARDGRSGRDAARHRRRADHGRGDGAASGLERHGWSCDRISAPTVPKTAGNLKSSSSAVAGA